MTDVAFSNIILAILIAMLIQGVILWYMVFKATREEEQ